MKKYETLFGIAIVATLIFFAFIVAQNLGVGQ